MKPVRQLLISFCFIFASHSEEGQKKEEEPPKIGNFALPSSQQPNGLFAFGGNMLDKNEVQLFFFADEFLGNERIISDYIPSVLFGLTDELSLLVGFPFSPIMQDGCDRSSGLEDFFLQVEYAFYNKKTAFYIDQATVVANVAAPTGSIHKHPPIGFGSTNFFIGCTFSRLYVDWFFFLGEGAILATSTHGNKIGDQFLYQCGFGRNIPTTCGSIFAWMVEIDGQYAEKNRFHGKNDSDSGGSYLLVTPSVFLSTKEILVQFGVSVPIYQNLFGKQRKFDYALNFNFGWSFY